MGEGPTKKWPGESAGLWPLPEVRPRSEERSDAERIRVIEAGIWIDHRYAREARERIVSFFRRPWAPHQRWRAMLLAGDPRSGRSAIVARAVEEVRGRDRPAVMLLPPKASEAALWTALIEATGPRWRRRSTTAEIREHAMDRLAHREGLVLDNGDVLAEMSRSQWRKTLARMKDAAEEKRIPLVLVVSSRAAAKILSEDDWGARFEAYHLPRWRLDQDFLDLLTEWEASLPLREDSCLSTREMALHLYSLCDGRMGRLAQILREAALAAIANATERITVAQLDDLGFSPPPSFRGFPF